MIAQKMQLVAEHVLTRVEQPRLQPSAHDSRDSQVGGQWNGAVPLPDRALNTPFVGAAMPAAPRFNDDFMANLGYCASLQSFLTYSFGWTRQDRGLRWWYDAGKPVNDSRLALINDVWEQRRQPAGVRRVVPRQAGDFQPPGP